MKQITITTLFTVYDSIPDLEIDIQNLMKEAIVVRKKHTLLIQSLKLAQRYF